ncbi:MAG: hypothetical protein H6Q52_1020 [Deltaproteobacteria bacterium]|nr:hypothetical protein [Deltaproteobacteria bacterium]
MNDRFVDTLFKNGLFIHEHYDNGGRAVNNRFVDTLFKIGILLIGVALLALFYFHSQTGRFQKIGDDRYLDTKEGILYVTFPYQKQYFQHEYSLSKREIKTFDVKIIGKATSPVPSPDFFDKKPAPKESTPLPFGHIPPPAD